MNVAEANEPKQRMKQESRKMKTAYQLLTGEELWERAGDLSVQTAPDGRGFAHAAVEAANFVATGRRVENDEVISDEEINESVLKIEAFLKREISKN